jgi:hypothetical protein
VHCALGLSLLRLLARPGVWAGSAWAGSPLPEAEELRPTALGGGTRSIPANRRRGEARKPAKVNWCQGWANFEVKRGESLPELGYPRRRRSGGRARRRQRGLQAEGGC